MNYISNVKPYLGVRAISRRQQGKFSVKEIIVYIFLGIWALVNIFPL